MTRITVPSVSREAPEADHIAVVGYAFKLPQDVNDDESFCDTLQGRRNLMTDWPESRVKPDSFIGNNHQKWNGQGGHFINEDVAAFDAPFFSVTAKEAAAMDPMQRWTLETTYHAFENAGIPMESLRGSRTAVFSTSMLEDYGRMTATDPDNLERTAVTGSTVSCIIPNRVSWYFDLRGASIHVNTACSSSLSAVDMACKALLSGDASCAVVTGANLLLDPSIFQVLSNQGFLSPDGVCYSFDHRANGYARGEGFITIVLKPVSAAIRDGDMIRAVIRAIGSNQDGQTPVLTQPSSQAQEDLIRHVYKQSNLSLCETRYVEAHGTGTPVGDPIEMKAIGRCFREFRSSAEPLFVGSVKANTGHLEGASALASLVKCVLILEKGIIPPNALFEKINPAIEADYYHTEIPTRSVEWPSRGLRRVSINSFGFGGSNSHVVLDDAWHYLQDRGLTGKHNTIPCPSATADVIRNANGSEASQDSVPIMANHDKNGRTTTNSPRLLVWTAADENAAKRTIQLYNDFYQKKVSGNLHTLDRLTHTLAIRRSRMLWRSFAVVSDGLDAQAFSPARPIRSSTDMSLAFIFTGQGAQYVDMGLGLVQYPVFARTLRRIRDIYSSFGCDWSLFDELHSAENINKPEYSQPLSTAVQIALVELLASFGITPKAVIGHSSGEIAAAYAAGALCLSSACKASYFRGMLAGKLRAESAPSPGAMISINLAENQVSEFLEKMGALLVHVACVNSPLNCTLSGPEAAIDAIKVQADIDGIFAQKLKTGVAYHSPSMQSIAGEYLAALDDLKGRDVEGPAIPMISSVTGKKVSLEVLATGKYWVDNMVSPVRFSEAVQFMINKSSALQLGLGNITDLVEIGPHPALRRPVKDTLHQVGNLADRVRYAYALHRSHSATQTTLELVGQLFCQGYAVSIRAANQQIDKQAFLFDCPSYPFDRSQRYWAESRLSRDFRLRGTVKGELLGVRASDWNPLEPRWSNFWSIESSPWVGHHKISDTVLYPASGMLVMAIEAAQQMVQSNRTITGYLVKRADFISPIIVQEAWEDRVETQVRLRPVKRQQNESGFDITIFAYSRGQWNECFRADIRADYQQTTRIDGTDERALADQDLRSRYQLATESCGWPIDSRVFYRDAAEKGLQYGDWFQLIHDIQWDGKQTAVARVDVSKARYETTSLVHPAVLDQAFQVLRVSAGQQSAENVPVSMENAWFSAKGWQHPQTKSIRWLSESTSTTRDYGERGSLVALSDDGRVLCSINSAVTASVSKDTAEKERKLVYSIEWKPQLSLLDPEQLTRECSANASAKDETTILANHSKLCSALELVAARTLKRIDRAKVPNDLRRHVEWVEHHVSKLTRDQLLEADTMTDAEVESRLQEVDAVLPAWKLYTTCGRKLPEMLNGDLDPLQVVFESNQADIFYADLFQNLCADGRLGHILDLASHENPAQRILEVGAGTGGMTGHVLTALQEREKRTGGLSFAEYTYTDISPAFFEPASRRWPDLQGQGRITFKTLDLDKPIDGQGFEPGSYDLVIAASVLHATPYLEATIRNVRKALKPGGGLVLLEVINPDDIATNFMAGLVPGWWVAREEWRPHSAAIPEYLWDKCLRANGFSGNDLVIRDYESDKCHIMSVIVTTAEAETETARAAPKPGGLVMITNGQEAKEQRRLADCLRRQLDPKGRRGFRVTDFSLDQLRDGLADLTKDDVVICLAEAGDRPLLSNLSEGDFKSLQLLTTKAGQLLWVTATSIANSRYPEYSIVQGFFRSIRAEQPDSHIVTLSIQGETDAETCAEYIAKTFRAAFDSTLVSKEVEYLVRDGLVMTGRAVEDITSNKMVQSLVTPQLQQKAWGKGPALKLSLGNPGTLDSLRFVKDDIYTTNVGPHEIEIEAKAWGLSSRDVEISLGRLDDHHRLLGGDCAGIVTRVGRDCDPSILPGDRVCMVAPGCMRKYARAHKAGVYKLPDSLSFEAAASFVVPAMTVCQRLLNIAQLQEDDKILIHAASGSVGQMAVRMAQAIGAQVFATVSSPKEKQLLVDKLSIPTDQIWDSQSTSFSQGVIRVTDGQGADVVLHSLIGEDALQASLNCLAAGGRFINVGRVNIEDGEALPMKMLTKNVTISSVDVLELGPKATARLLKQSMTLLSEGKLQMPQPLQVVSVSKIEDAFRQLQEGEIIGRLVVTPGPDDVVPQFVQEQRPWKFDPNASYLIAGGSGGLGRAVVRWMAGRGAKHLIVPSRSGASSKAARKMVEELRSRGINIVAPKCDVSVRQNVADMLSECSRTMPPVKGSINAAMVLQDAIFQDSMTFAQWDLTMRSKVQTSQNLHELLPKDLDFFILLSSLAGVVGQMASANYAGGCAYQDALAAYRIAHGQKALSLDIGWMRNIGIIAESGAYQRQRQTSNDMQPIDDNELLALLTLCCDPDSPYLVPPHAKGQVLFGLRTPADILMHGQSPPTLLERPLLAAFSYLVSAENTSDREVNHLENAKALFRGTKDSGERASIVMQALAAKLARAMSISADDVEPSKPLSAYGVDSLMAVELRNWINKEFNTTIAVFDIMGGVPITRIAELVVTRSSV